MVPSGEVGEIALGKAGSMRIGRMLRTVCTAAALVAGCVGTAARTEAASIVVNGGFETHDFSGWTTTSSDIFICGTSGLLGCDDLDGFSGFGTPHSGVNAATMGTISPAGIFQSLATSTGTLYTLDFWFSVCPVWGGGPGAAGCALNSLSVLWGGTTIFEQFNVDPAPWTHVVIPNLLALGSLTDLRFLASNDASYFLLDDISVEALDATAVPEPATMTLLGTGDRGADRAPTQGRRARVIRAFPWYVQRNLSPRSGFPNDSLGAAAKSSR